MALYATEQELQDGLATKVDKASLDTQIITDDDTRVVSSKLIKRKLAEVKLPQNLKKCIEQFDNMYLGYKATHPTEDINGAILSTGLMYYNTTDHMLYIWDGIWRPTLSTDANLMPLPVDIKKFDVEATTTTNTILIPNGYNPDNVSVYLDGVRMSTDDYTATNGTSIVFAQNVSAGQVISGFSSSENILENFDVEATGTTSSIGIPNGYDPNTVSVYLDGVRMSIIDYTATDGNTITFKKPISAGQVVSGFYIKNYSDTVKIVTEYDKIENAPNPAKNGALAFDLTRGQLYYYSATLGKWVSREGAVGDVGFYDSKEEFEDETVAKTDKLYIDRSTKISYLFNGSKYVPFHTWHGEYLPNLAEGVLGTLYFEEKSKILYYFDGVMYKELANPNKEEVQVKDNVGDFIARGEDLYLAKDEARLYTWNGIDFVPITTLGAGEAKFIEDEAGLQPHENIFFINKETGKSYYYNDNKYKRANKEVWRIATDSDLNNSTKDEDFIYLIDDTNVLKKYDKEHDRFETLGTPKVLHTFAKESEINHVEPTPTRSEAEQYANSKGITDSILWGNLTDNDSIACVWAYSVDSEGNCVLIYAKEVTVVTGFFVIDGEQSFNGTLEIRVENGLIEVKDGGGNTINIKDTSSNGNLSDGTGALMCYYNGQKFPKIDTSINNNEAIVNTDRLLNSNILYDNDFIEIIK